MQISSDSSLGLSALAAAYLKEDERLMPFFNGRFSEKASFQKVAQNINIAHRTELVAILEKQNESFGNINPKTQANLQKLRSSDALVVVTGQQVGLFTGAAYTLYKTLTTIQLAKKLSADLGRAVVPVFWLETEDHDLEEANHVGFFRGNEVVNLTYTGHQAPVNGNLGSVGKIRFNKQIAEVVDELEALLPPTEFREDLMQKVRAAYAEGKNFTEAFAAMLLHLVPDEGIILACGYNKALKSLALPLFQKALDEYQTADEILQNTSKSLIEAGFHAQVNPRPTNVFYMTSSGRYALEPEGAAFKLRGQGETLKADALVYPRFSPNVVLRPLVQDYLFPTIAYVAGPGEVAYFAQLKGLYDWAGIPMPVIYPRASVTVVENRVAKIMEKEGLNLADVYGDLESLFKQKVLQKSDKNIEEAFQSLQQELERLGKTVSDLAQQVDVSLLKSAEALKANWQNESTKLEKKLIAAEKRNHDQLRSQLERVQSALFPNGVGQERVLSPLYFVNKFGFDFVKELLQNLPLETHEHQRLLI